MIYTYPVTHTANDLVDERKLHDEIAEALPSNTVESVGLCSGDIKIDITPDLTAQEEITLSDTVAAHNILTSFLTEQALTDKRNAEGFELYKQIFAHISDTDPVTSIDSFITISDKLHKLRNFLKDGNFETAVRYMYTEIIPLNAFLHQELYRQWIREIAKKYNSNMSDAVLDAIEQAPAGMV